VLVTNPINNVANVTDAGTVPGVGFVSTTALVSNTAEVVFSAASNVSGAVLIAGSFVSANITALPAMALMYGTTLPATWGAKPMIYSGQAAILDGTLRTLYGQLPMRFRMPAANGAWHLATPTETGGGRALAYTFL
jgi:hypothetical protein